jgi:hypothetical protein
MVTVQYMKFTYCSMAAESQNCETSNYKKQCQYKNSTFIRMTESSLLNLSSLDVVMKKYMDQ